MAKCDEGYVCQVCGEPVQGIANSELYLRYVIGEVDSDALLGDQECHLRCRPTTSQYIVHPDFKPVVCEGFFDKRLLDQTQVKKREELVTRGWLRLREVAKSKLPIAEYPLTTANSQ